MVTSKMRRLSRNPLVILVAAGSTLAIATGIAGAAGGTAKPVKGAVSPWVIPTLPDPAFTADPATIHGFDDIGVIRSATVSNANCPSFTDTNTFGGSVTLNGLQITIPCNLIVQMPANTLPWAQFVNGTGGTAPLPTDGLELRAVGNILGANRTYVAGLAYASQQSTAVGHGQITALNYTDGSMTVTTSAGNVKVQINDPAVAGLTDSAGNPTGRFSVGKSPDARFSVDQDNPTVHSGTGYPMCIPRTDPATADDPLCPQQNRPLAPPVPNPTAIPACRNFSVAGVTPPVSGELNRPPAGQVYCSEYVMPAPPAAGVVTTTPNSRQQAPFEVGDYISYSGTLFGSASAGTEYVSAHTIEANVGIFTQPGTQPAYVSIGDFGVGTADPLATAVNGAAQETQNRIFLEAMTTDIKTPVDIYYLDNNTDGSIRNRWITPTEMTGENATPASGPTGGITTQNAGPQPGRARLRAVKAPVGLLSQPSRNVRVAQRSQCLPTPVDPTTTTINQAALDLCMNNAPLVANGLKQGEYTAPTFEYIFPENVRAGDVLVPNDLWHIPALVKGEGTGNTQSLTPTPW